MAGDDEVSAGQDRRLFVLESYGRLSKVPETGELEKVEDQRADDRVGRRRARLELSDGLSAWKRCLRRKDW